MTDTPQSKGRILVSPRSLTKGSHPALARLTDGGYTIVRTPEGRHPSPDELQKLLPGCVGYIAGVEPVSGDLLRSASDKLRVISRNGTGVDNIDLAATKDLGIQVLNAAGANARSVAELTWGLLLSLARSIPAADAIIKQGKWQRFPGIELQNRRLGVIGCGNVGKIVAGYGAAFGMKVRAYDPFPDTQSGIDFTSLENLLASSDIITLHCPPSNKPIIGATELATIPAGTLLINTARADLIDDSAVLAALDSGQLDGYATDVFPTEPPSPGDPLANHPKVIASPHTGAFTKEAIDRAAVVAVQQLLDALEHRVP